MGIFDLQANKMVPNEGQFFAIALCRHCTSFGPVTHYFGPKPRTTSKVQVSMSTSQVQVRTRIRTFRSGFRKFSDYCTSKLRYQV